MLAFNEVAPPIPSLCILRKRDELEAFWMAFRIIIAVRTAKSSTVFSFSLRRRRGSILRSESVVHCGKNERESPYSTVIPIKLTTQVNVNLAIMFAQLQIQYGAGNCKKGYSSYAIMF